MKLKPLLNDQNLYRLSAGFIPVSRRFAVGTMDVVCGSLEFHSTRSLCSDAGEICGLDFVNSLRGINWYFHNILANTHLGTIWQLYQKPVCQTVAMMKESRRGFWQEMLSICIITVTTVVMLQKCSTEWNDKENADASVRCWRLLHWLFCSNEWLAPCSLHEDQRFKPLSLVKLLEKEVVIQINK